MLMLTGGIFVLKYLFVQRFNVHPCTKCLEIFKWYNYCPKTVKSTAIAPVKCPAMKL